MSGTSLMERAEAAMRACVAAQGAPRPVSSGLGSVTPEELEELRRIPGNEGVRVPARRPETAARPSPVRPIRVCYRLAPDSVGGVPMLARVTVAVFADTHDPEMADAVAEAAMRRLGLRGEVVS